MSSLQKERLIFAFKQLGELMANPDAQLRSIMAMATNNNAWFTEEEVNKALKGLASMLTEKDLIKWFNGVEIAKNPKKIGLILAGNIPMVGLHDVICVLATGNIAQIKLSSSDNKLLPYLLNELVKYEPLLSSHIIYTEQLKGFDAVIATGSNNTSRYFEYYFGKMPHIIRRNRNSVAILTGNETKEELNLLGHDILDYFGMGCRNVSKLFIPEHYDIKQFFEAIESFQPIIHHFKYNNNYDYNKSIYLVNQQPHYDNGFILLKEDVGLSSPLAVLYYENYHTLPALYEKLNDQKEHIQCVVGGIETPIQQTLIGFGQSQYPKLWDYADKIDTIAFLNSLQY